MKYTVPEMNIKVFGDDAVYSAYDNMIVVSNGSYNDATVSLKEKLRQSAEQTTDIVVFRWQ